MICCPALFIGQALNGLTAWALNVLPSVLPFMFFTRLLSELGQMQIATKPFGKFSMFLFRTPPISVYTFLMAILSGYPVGSKMVADLYECGKINKSQAFRMSSFCSTSGPMFIIGAVGIGMFKSATVGYILFLSHALGALLNGILFRNLQLKGDKIFFSFKKHNKESERQLIDLQESNTQAEEKVTKINISDIVTSSTLAILSVGCIITIFFIIIECFAPLLNLLPVPIAYFLEGIIEITKGCIDLAQLSNIKLATFLCSFVISFGGISTLIQSITMLKKVEMPIWLFALEKLSHAVICALITLPLIFIAL